MNIVHKVIMGQNDTMIQVDMSNTFWDVLKSVVVGILIGAIVMIAISLTAGVLGVVASGIMALLAAGGTVSITLGTGAVLLTTGAGLWSAVTYYNTQLPTNVVLPMFSISPEEIFQGKILLFDIDFFNPVTDIYVQTIKKDSEGNEIDGNAYNLNNYDDQELKDKMAENGETIKNYFYINDDGEHIPTSKQNTALDLQNIVSQWYLALRNIAIVLSMSVLLYIGIRMLLSTVAQDKAKYKQMLADWIVSICLLFFMHYIMAFSVAIVKQLNNVLVYEQEQDIQDIEAYTGAIELDKDGKIREKLEDLGREDLIQETKKVDENGSEVDTEFVIWPTNLMGQLRIAAQMSYGDASYIGYAICYFILTLLTVFFIFVYLKRVLYMAFLTMIAPLVALTYPIDKISDGQAQAFNKWLKEYIFNLLIQPLHLIIYTVLVSSAFELASTNAIYSLVAIGFLIPAERLMRSFFGFEKASTPPSMAGLAVGAGLVNTGIHQLLHKPPQGRNGNNGSNGSGGDNSNSSIRIGAKQNGPDPLDVMAGSTISNGNNDGNSDGAQPPKTLDSGNSENKETQEPNYDEEALKKYQNEGFGQNAFGHYFNPHESEFDPNYDPRTDKDYNEKIKNEEEAMQNYKNEGFGQNAFGHYFNPSQSDFDPDYDPRTDAAFNKGLKQPEKVDTGTQPKPIDAGDQQQPIDVGTREEEGTGTNNNGDYSIVGNVGRKFMGTPVGHGVKTITGAAGNVAGKGKAKVQGVANKVGDAKRAIQNNSKFRYFADSKEGRAIKGAGRVLKTSFGQSIKGYKQGIKQGARQAPGVIAGAVIGATAGAVGMAAGIAAGDPSKAASYAAGAAVTGGAFGKKAFTISPRNGQESAEKIARDRAFYGDKYDEHVAEKNMKKWRKDDENRQELERYLGAEKVKELYKGDKDAKINKYLQNEITDAKDIAALEQLQEKEKVTFNDAMVFYDAHSRYGDIPKGDPKKKKEIKADYAEQFEQRGNSKDEANAKAQRIVDMTHTFNSYKKDLNKS